MAESDLHPKHRGAANELEAVLWLMNKGYEVFRNVSQHGSIDIIALRGTEELRLDVCSVLKRGSKEQREFGVKCLFKEDGEFKIEDILPPLAEVVCECGNVFIQKQPRHKFCSAACRNAHARGGWTGNPPARWKNWRLAGRASVRRRD